jgi:hypothetical protein
LSRLRQGKNDQKLQKGKNATLPQKGSAMVDLDEGKLAPLNPPALSFHQKSKTDPLNKKSILDKFRNLENLRPPKMSI